LGSDNPRTPDSERRRTCGSFFVNSYVSTLVSLLHESSHQYGIGGALISVDTAVVLQGSEFEGPGPEDDGGHNDVERMVQREPHDRDIFVKCLRIRARGRGQYDDTALVAALLAE
jgi:hypothetical protein